MFLKKKILWALILKEKFVQLKNVPEKIFSQKKKTLNKNWKKKVKNEQKNVFEKENFVS